MARFLFVPENPRTSRPDKNISIRSFLYCSTVFSAFMFFAPVVGCCASVIRIIALLLKAVNYFIGIFSLHYKIVDGAPQPCDNEL